MKDYPMNHEEIYKNRIKLKNIIIEIYIDTINSRIEKHKSNNWDLSNILSEEEMILLAGLLK